VLLTRAGLGELKQVRMAGIHYPRLAIGARLEGTVTVEATIAPDGGVVNVKTTPDKSLLANTAADSIRGWRFEPSLSAENRSARFTVEFRLIDECKLQCCYDQWIFEFPDHMIVTANTLPVNTSSSGSDKKSK
jgi:TonB family protein